MIAGFFSLIVAMKSGGQSRAGSMAIRSPSTDSVKPRLRARSRIASASHIYLIGLFNRHSVTTRASIGRDASFANVTRFGL